MAAEDEDPQVTFEAIAQVMERALGGIVASLQTERETTTQRLEDIKRRIAIMQKIESEAHRIRSRAAKERWRKGL